MNIARSPIAVVRPSSFARALGHRNYRLFVIGQGISLIGTWMQQLGLSWLTYELTRSAWLLALVSFSGQIPALILTPIAGVFSDRWSRHRMLIATQSIAMLQSTMLVFLMWRGEIQVWQIIGLSLVMGMVNAFDMPTRQAFLVNMVPVRDDLPNAVALNSSMVNGARLVGPFLAGLLIASGGAISCFMFNAVSYLAVLFALALMRDLPRPIRREATPVVRGLMEGLQYAWGFAPIRTLLSMAALVSLAGASAMMLMPIFAEEILHGGPKLLGFLTGASGAGALLAALLLLTRRSILGLGRWITVTTALFGLGLLGLAVSRSIPLSLLLLVPTGFSMMFQMAASNTLLQTIVEEDKRGRVMSLYALAFLGTAPLGSLLAGGIAEWFGAPSALVVAGLSCLAGALLFHRNLPMLREQIRPIYIYIGVLPADETVGVAPKTASAVETTAELTPPPEKPV